MSVDYITNSYMYYYINTYYNEYQSHVLNLDLAKGTSVPEYPAVNLLPNYMYHHMNNCYTFHMNKKIDVSSVYLQTVCF